MDPGKKFRRRFLPLLENGDLMNIPFCFQARITLPAISMNYAAWLYGFFHKRMQTMRRGILNSLHSSPTDFSPILLCCNNYQRVLLRFSTTCTFFQASNIGFIHFDPPRKSVTSGSDHRSPQLVQPSPRSLIATQFKNPLQTQSACTILLSGYPPNCSEPHSQRFMSVLKNCSGYYRRPVSTSRTLKQSRPYRPSLFMSTTWTMKAIRPAQLKKDNLDMLLP